ncbi:undecaprenyl-diphosphate phosphatase [bacterium]|nr:undecaprenyl-diphosphate phosphatase [bacterium]
MGTWESIGLGILQGMTEFLPVSSSGHLSIFEYFLGLEETPRFFDVMLHVGTLLAVLLFYRTSPIEIWKKAGTGSFPLRSRLLVLAGFVILATLPAVGAGAIFRPTKLLPGQTLDQVDRSWTEFVGDLREYSSQQPQYVLSFMTLTGAVLLAGSRAQGGTVDAHTMKWWQALGIGLGQMLSALLPGLSRSGMTVSTGLLLGLRGEWAVHFSLLMSLPAVLGATVLKAKDADPSWIAAHLGPTAWGTLTAAFVGWFCITLLLKAVKRGRWWWFAIYVWIFVATSATLLSNQKNALPTQPVPVPESAAS